MTAVFAYSLVLVLASLLSQFTRRSVLSTAVMFLVAGFFVGDGVLGYVTASPDSPIVKRLAEICLFAVLLTDGMRVSMGDLASAWRLPGRALLLGMPLTLLLTALLGRFVAGLSWPAAFLVAAVLAPTDPVFASAIVGREEIPYRLRHLLNVESGLNDGLALPLVLGILVLSGSGHEGVGLLLGELALGVAVGVGIPWVAIMAERRHLFAVARFQQPLFVFGIGLLVLSLAWMSEQWPVKANPFLAAFAAGVTMASVWPAVKDEFHGFGEPMVELLKLAAILAFGTIISPRYFTEISWRGYLFVVLALVLARPLALSLALVRSELDRRERLTCAWFGPKGFASVVYGILVWHRAVPGADHLFHLIAVTIIVSIIAHSSTDVLVARWFRGEERDPDEEGQAEEGVELERSRGPA